MSNENKTYKETIKWTDKDNAVLYHEEGVPTYDNDDNTKVTGVHKQVGHQKCTYEDLTSGLNKTELTLSNKKMQLKTSEKRRGVIEKTLKDIQMPIDWSPSLKKLQKQLQAINFITELEQKRKEEDRLKNDINYLERIIKVRNKTISSRPE